MTLPFSTYFAGSSACAAQAIRGLYVVPGNDNPTTATMSANRRRAIAEIARRRDIVVIEDDAYGRLASASLPPLASLAPERTWHVASLSKSISPSLRIAAAARRLPSRRPTRSLALG